MLEAFGGCAAAFLSEIKRGYALSNVYDHMIFPSDPSEKGDWETEHNGKVVHIPRPVAALRLWDSSSQSYVDISPAMAGAPALEEREAHWQQFLEELRSTLNTKYGPDFVDDCIILSKEELKSKYGL